MLLPLSNANANANANGNANANANATDHHDRTNRFDSPSPQQQQQQQQQQWIVFTAGVYGAGKSHTIRKLQSHGCFPSTTLQQQQQAHIRTTRHSHYNDNHNHNDNGCNDNDNGNGNDCNEPQQQQQQQQQQQEPPPPQQQEIPPPPPPTIRVDQDQIRRRLPEFDRYPARNDAGRSTQKEAGMVAELLTDAALDRGYNVLVDGSLKDAHWHLGYFERLRARQRQHHQHQQRRNLRIGILYVEASATTVGTLLQRIRDRERTTGRAVPIERLQESLQLVPSAVETLQHAADFFVEVRNEDEHQDEHEHEHEHEHRGDRNNEHDANGKTPPPPVAAPSSQSPPQWFSHGNDDEKSELEKTMLSERCRWIMGH